MNRGQIGWRHTSLLTKMLLTTALLAGCGGSDSESSPAPTTLAVVDGPTNPTAVISGMQEYTSVEDLISDLRRGNVSCMDPSVQAGTMYAMQSARCTYQGTEVVIAIYESVEKRDQNARTLLSVASLDPVLIVGANWLVNMGSFSEGPSRDDAIAAFQAAIGGRAVNDLASL